MHKQYLLAALEQAESGRGLCSPNPSVGAVVVVEGKIIAKDYHHAAGSAHAEARILAQLVSQTPDAILYVTLEPCNHWGKTPPCVDAIINQGIKTVVFGYRDPNPAVMKNDTPAILARHGVKAIFYPLPEIDAFYESYEYWCVHKRPFITAKIAQTLDSKIANPDGSPCQISNEACHHFTHQQRLKTDLILTSAKTILCDNPSFTARLNGMVYDKNIAILDRNLSLNLSEKVFQQAKQCYVYHAQGKKPKKSAKRVDYQKVREYNDRLALDEVINHLGQLGFHDVWVEAGAQVFQALHLAGLVNRSYIYIAPKLLGAEAPSAFLSDCFNEQQKKTIHWLVMGDNCVLRLDWR